MQAAILPARPSNAIGLAWREARPVVQVMFQLRFVAGAGMAAAAAPVHWSASRAATVLIGMAAWLFTTWHIYLLNGVCDLTEDRVNGSARPLASGALPVTAARYTLGMLAVAAVACAAAVSPAFVVLVLAMLGLGWLYSAGPLPAKANMLGFVAVVVGGGVLTYLAGWCAAGGGTPGAPVCVLAAAMSLWMGTAGMTKDLSDVAGDRAAGRRTMPIVVGERRARALLGALAVGVGTLALLASYRLAPSMLPMGAILLGGAAMVAVALKLRGRVRLPYRTFMITQYLVHLAVLGHVLV